MSGAGRVRVADRLAPFGTTIFTEMTLLAQKHGAVNLAQGFPDFDGPEFVKAAACEAVGAGQNQYARMFGIPALNRAIAEYWRFRTGMEVDPDAQVTVTTGCTEGIAAAMLGLLNPGDEVVMFEPYYDSYIAAVAMAGGVARCVTLRAPGRRLRQRRAEHRHTNTTSRRRGKTLTAPPATTGLVGGLGREALRPRC